MWKCYMQSARRKYIVRNSNHLSVIQMLLFTTAVSFDVFFLKRKVKMRVHYLWRGKEDLLMDVIYLF